MKLKFFATIIFWSIITYSNAGSVMKNDPIRFKVFQYLKSRYEFSSSEDYNWGYAGFAIYDICIKREITKTRYKCVCGFGAYNEERNYYLFFRNGSKIVFINPPEMKLEEALKQLSIVFYNGYPCDKEFVIKYVKDFYEGNTNSLSFLNGISPNGVRMDSTIIPRGR